MATITEVEANNTRPTANTVTLGDTARGSLLSKDDVDYYKVVFTSAGVLKYTISSAATASSWAYKLVIEDSTGAQIAASSIGFGYGSTVEAAIRGAGEYFVRLTSDANFSSAQYDLTLSKTAGNVSDYESGRNVSRSTADAIALDHTYIGQLANGRTSDFYRVAVNGDGVLTVDVTAASARNFTTINVKILDVDGNVLASQDTGSHQPIFTNVTSAGAYFVQISGFGFDGGNYRINAHLDQIAAVSKQTLADSVPQAGTLAAGGHNWYKVNLTAGTIYEFKIAGAASGGGTLVDPTLALSDASFKVLESTDNLRTYTTQATSTVDPEIGFIAPATGIYYLMASGTGGGTYTITEKSDAIASINADLVSLQKFPLARWNAGSALGTPISLTYSFLNATADGHVGFISMNAAQQQAVKNVLAMYSTIAKITFTEVTTSTAGQLRFGMADLSKEAGGSAGVADSTVNSNGNFLRQDVFLDLKQSNIVNGSYALETLIHETGHALGLKHPGNYNGNSGSGIGPYIPLALDNRKFTVMSYVDNPDTTIFHDTPGLFDISAIQYLYGVNRSGAGQAHSFTFSNSQAFESALISNGTNDTIDISNQTLGTTIRMAGSTFSSIGVAAAGNTAAHDNVLIPFGATVVAVIGGRGNDDIIGNDLNNVISGGVGNDTITSGSGSDSIDGGADFDIVAYFGNRSGFAIQKIADGFKLTERNAKAAVDTIINIEKIQFADLNINLQIGSNARSIAAADLKSLEELYVAFFNRIPDADGLNYWINDFKSGRSISAIAESFYDAATSSPYYALYSKSMSNLDFIKIVYANVLSRSSATVPADQEGLNYWTAELASHTRGDVVKSMLYSAHTLSKTDPVYGFSPRYLDNKVDVADFFAVRNGLNYNSAQESVDKTTLIAAAVTATDITAAIALIGIPDSGFSLV